MKLRAIGLLASFMLVTYSCGTGTSGPTGPNPPEDGFNLEHSDPAAVELADSIMVAMGGRSNWDQIRYLSWSFDSIRNLVWDKSEERVRIESIPDTTLYLIDLKTNHGRVRIGSYEIKDSDSLAAYIKEAKDHWIHDLHWLILPFKLKSAGVTIKYLGEEAIEKGRKCNVLEVSVSDQGRPPLHYWVYVDLADNLVKQWSFRNANMSDTVMLTYPWDNYKRYGKILLSANRSDGNGPHSVRVHQNLPDEIFTEF